MTSTSWFIERRESGSEIVDNLVADFTPKLWPESNEPLAIGRQYKDGVIGATNLHLIESGFLFPDGATIDDYVQFGKEFPFTAIQFTVNSLSVELKWQYWNGSDWADLTMTTGYDGLVSWQEPADWTRDAEFYFSVRAVIISGTIVSPEGSLSVGPPITSPDGTTVNPAISISVRNNNYRGVLLKLRAQDHGYDEITYRVYRDHKLLAEVKEVPAGENLSPRYLIDYTVLPGSRMEYFLEIIGKGVNLFQYQVSKIIQYIPCYNPRSPRSISVAAEILGTGYQRRATVTWNYDAQDSPYKNPDGFEISSPLLASSIYIRLRRFSYQYSTSFDYIATAQVEGNVEEIAVTVKGYRDSYIDNSGNKLASPVRFYGPSVTDSTELGQYFSIPEPRIVFETPSFIFEGLDHKLIDGVRPGYTFDVTIDIPDYDSREVDGFEISADRSYAFPAKRDVTPTSKNQYIFQETNIPIDRKPVYFVRAFVNTVEDGQAVKKYSDTATMTADLDNLVAQYDIDFLIQNPSADTLGILDFYNGFDTVFNNSAGKGENNSALPLNLGTPAITVYYNGDSLSRWIDNEIGRLSVPEIKGSVTTVEELPEEPDADDLVKIDDDIWKYQGQGDGTFLWEKLEDTMTEEERDEDIVYIVEVATDDTTSYYQWDNTTLTWRLFDDVFHFRLNKVVREALNAAYLPCQPPDFPELPEIITRLDAVEIIDSFMLNSYKGYGLQPRVFDGPVIAFRGSPAVYLPPSDDPFSEDELVAQSSRVRVGPDTFGYGALTGIERISDVAARINGTGQGYLADLIVDGPLNGGELEIEYGDLKYMGEMPDTSSLAGNREIVFDEYEEIENTGTGEIYYKGTINTDYVKEFLQAHPKSVSVFSDDCNIRLEKTLDGGIIVRIGKLMARHVEKARIRLLPPYAEDPSLPWHPRVDPGRFTTHVGTGTLEFSLLEFPYQNWSIKYGAPFKNMVGERGSIVDRKTIQVSRGPIAIDHPDFVLTVEGISWTHRIEDFDAENRLIFLTQALPARSMPEVSYIYKERSFVYPLVNLNPHKRWGNQEIAGKYVAILMHPVTDSEIGPGFDNFYGQNRTVFHRVFSTIEDLEAFMLSNSEFNNPEQLFLVGYYYISEGDPDRVQINDARRRGGGLRRDITFENAFMKNPAIGGYYDIGYWDGVPFATTACIVKLPSYVRDRLTDTEILAAVTKHMAFGTLPVIKFVDDQHLRENDSTTRIIFPLSSELTEPEFGAAFGEIYGVR